MKRIIFIALTGLLLSSSVLSAAPVIVSGIKFPDKIGYNKKVMYLNGAGIRTKFFMNIYVAGLYVTNKSKDAEYHINNNEAMTMRLTIISSMLTSQTMQNAIREGYDRSLNGNVSEIQEQIDLICKLFAISPTKVGDQYDLNFTPGIGFSTTKNGKSYTYAQFGKFGTGGETLEGNAVFNAGKNNMLKKASFGIWLGKNPVDEGLKEALLGIEDED